MTIATQDVQSIPTDNSMDLAVVQNGMTIAVSPGPFTCNGIEYVLAEEQEYTAQEQSQDCTVCGYLVRSETTNEIYLLVDEILNDGVDEPIVFNSLSDTEVLACLFHLTVPANTGSLDGLTITSTRIVAPDEETKDNG